MVQVRPDTLLAWEQGSKRPTFPQLERLARKYHRPVAAFFLPRPPTEPPLPRDFRQRPGRGAGAFSPETRLAFRQAARLQAIARELLPPAAEGGGCDLPSIAGMDAEAAASVVRERLGVTVEEQTALPDTRSALWRWRTALEARGVIVLQLPMPLEDARGFSLPDWRAPAIVVNSKDAVQARIFTLFHELAHLLLSEPGVCLAYDTAPEASATSPTSTTEVFCNRFSGALVLPLWSREVAARLEAAAPDGTPDEDLIGETAKRFKVSRYVVLRRLLAARMISAEAYEEKNRAWDSQWAGQDGSAGGGPSPPVRSISERGRAFVTLVLDALDEGRISTRDAMDFLGVRYRHFQSIRERLESAPNE